MISIRRSHIKYHLYTHEQVARQRDRMQANVCERECNRNKMTAKSNK